MTAVAGLEGRTGRGRPGAAFRQALETVLALRAHADARGTGKLYRHAAVGPVAEDDLGHGREDGEGKMEDHGQKADGGPSSIPPGRFEHAAIVNQPVPGCQTSRALPGGPAEV